MQPDRSEVERRVSALSRLRVLESLPPEAFQRIVRVAAHLAGGEGTTISAVVHLLDDAHQHRVAAVGSARQPFSLEESLCGRVLGLDRVVYSEDASTDPRLAGSPWTSGDEPLRLYLGIPLRLSDGTAVGTLCLMDTRHHQLSEAQRTRIEDLAALAAGQLDLLELTHELGHDASHDALTGVANRVVLSQRLGLALARRTSSSRPPVLVLVDLDRFKAVNDEHGHAVGDEVLVSTAARLQATVRPEDLVARLGGDEFAVLLDEVPTEASLADLVRRLADTADAPHDTAAGPVRCGFTLGVAHARAGDLPYVLLGRADDDLYARKASRSRSA